MSLKRQVICDMQNNFRQELQEPRDWYAGYHTERSIDEDSKNDRCVVIGGNFNYSDDSLVGDVIMRRKG